MAYLTGEGPGLIAARLAVVDERIAALEAKRPPRRAHSLDPVLSSNMSPELSALYDVRARLVAALDRYIDGSAPLPE